ncbi:E3 SUMO-protein ligase NSE2 isoform X2 [Takifugu rubripes]|uniref:E3 SUMO-protein ligase NSE2 isoform X2 n=1 Tax=Takifugu rubripes TaxID=31033 RepID=UPI0011458E6A|nr:E3 SUMO-protein ligase NSE2 isoform X2 [Takifugu rubripes]XP_056901011.1 E3 SUMO-protein ligase NSE2 isoform X2 [Takifugu flavidus]
MSLSSVHGTLSSLKTCQTDIGTGMDTITDVALDLVETQDKNMTTSIKEMEAMILECAKLDREINNFVDVMKQATSEISTQNLESMVNLSTKAKELFRDRMSRLSDADLQNHPKVVAFKDNIQNSSSQGNQNAEENSDEMDDEITVTQTQVNLTCPLTKMVNPVKNKKCSHNYDQEAILSLITNKQKQKKTCCCPVVGCANSDVRQMDLVPDQVLRRMIQSQKRQGTKT